jgi:Fur family peroxide stress response transcriptional regulator
MSLKNDAKYTQKEERLSQMLAKLKSRDFRLTPQRLAILKILAGSEDHPSVDTIYTEVRITV